MSGGKIHFKCPNCDDGTLLEKYKSTTSTAIESFDEFGDIDGEVIDTNFEELIEFACGNCGQVIKTKFGIRIKNNEDLINWLTERNMFEEDPAEEVFT